MVLSASSPLFAYAGVASSSSSSSSSSCSSSSACASPATSTDSHGGSLSPAALAKLPGLQFAIAHRRGDLRLPSLAVASSSSSSSSSASNENVPMNGRLFLSMPPQCDSPHFLCPETSPLMDKSSATRKKGTRRGTLNAEAKNVLKAWMFSPEHFAHPYPSEEEKEELAMEAGIEVKQLSNWFTNARKRLWQPVLRQSGVEVKNFLSTGRGGPRGNKLDVPANLQHLIAQKEAEDDEQDAAAASSPPASPSAPADARVATLKRSWADMQQSSPAPSATVPQGMDEVASMRKKKSVAPQRKRTKDCGEFDDDAPLLTSTASQLSQELRLALANHMTGGPAAASVRSAAGVNAEPCVNKFKDIEILAAASLIGLFHQPYQPVH